MERYLTTNRILSILSFLSVIFAAIRFLLFGFLYPFALLVIAYLALFIIVYIEPAVSPMIATPLPVST